MAKSDQLVAELTDGFSNSLDDLMRTNSSLARECHQLMDTIQWHNTYITIAKSMAMIASGVGALACMGGIEWAHINKPGVDGPQHLIGGGIVCSAIGGIAYVGTGLADYIGCSCLRTRLVRLVEQRYRCFDRTIGRFEASIVDNFGPNYVPTNRPIIHYKDLIYKLGDRRDAGMAGAKATHTHSWGSLFYSMTNIVIKLWFPLAFVLSAKTSMEWQLREHMTAIGLALTVVDAVYLVRDWNKAHPTVEAINGLITDLESDHKTIQFIQTIKNINQ